MPHACACVYVLVSAHTRAMHRCESNTCASTKLMQNHAHSFSLALSSSFQLLHVVFILHLVNHASFRVASAIRECTACASMRTRECY